MPPFFVSDGTRQDDAQRLRRGMGAYMLCIWSATAEQGPDLLPTTQEQCLSFWSK